MVSVYAVAQYKVHKTTFNESVIQNVIKREFERETPLEVVVSDLTYVRVAGRWNYVCVLVD